MSSAVATQKFGGGLTGLLVLVALLVLASGIGFFVLENRPTAPVAATVPATTGVICSPADAATSIAGA